MRISGLAQNLSFRLRRKTTRRQLPPVERISFILGIYFMVGISNSIIEKITYSAEWYISQATNGQQVRASP